MRAIAVVHGSDLRCENILPCKVIAAVDEGTYSSCSVVDGCDFSLSPCCENLLPREVVAAVDEGTYSSCYVVDGSDLSPGHTETVTACCLMTQMIQVARYHHLQHHLHGSNSILKTDGHKYMYTSHIG